MLQIRHILVPIDFSECSQAAVAYAVGLADTLGAELEILHVWDAPPSFVGELGELTVMAPEGRTTVVELVRVRAAQKLAAVVSDARRASRVRIRARTEFGDAGSMILKVAASGHHDLIVMGTHGRTGLSRMMMGSVAEKVLRRASCPVVTVRAPVRSDAKREEVAS